MDYKLMQYVSQWLLCNVFPVLVCGGGTWCIMFHEYGTRSNDSNIFTKSKIWLITLISMQILVFIN